MKPNVTISIVSHMQADLVDKLLSDIAFHCKSEALDVVVTLNLLEELPFSEKRYPFPVAILRNSVPLGFAANHNQAFTHARGQYFCVMNPDIRLSDDPFQVLVTCLGNPFLGVVAPLVLSENGKVEDSARHFPTPLKILGKAFGRYRDNEYAVEDKMIFPDWVGGMFMLFPRLIFEKLGGFNPRFFLYYEDVDLCARLRLGGYEVALCPDAKVIHQARRDSHRNLKYLKWHLASMTRFFCSSSFLRICWLRLTRRHLNR